jgi:hypothetical protein
MCSNVTDPDVDESQNQDPQLNIIPTTDRELSQLIVAEANYDRWSNFLFPHSKSNDLYGRRKRQWNITLPNGTEKSAQIEVIPAQDEKSYTTKSYDVFLAVTEIWKSRGMPDEVMEIYLGDIAKILDLKENGRVVNMVMDELRCLYDTKVSWVFSFHSTDTKEDTYKNQRVLETFDYVQKAERNHGKTKTTCSIRLSEHIRLNIRNKITIPINFAARKKIRSSIAKALYSRLDNLLTQNPIYERHALGLIDDLNITPGRYRYKSQRKILLQTLQKNLDGAEMSRLGLRILVEVKETTDGEDWKCIFRTKNDIDVLENISTTYDDTSIKLNENEQYLFEIIESSIGQSTQYIDSFKRIAQLYAEDLLLNVLEEWLDTVTLNRVITDPPAYFIKLMHYTAHKKGFEWIEPCQKSCRYRPENMHF